MELLYLTGQRISDVLKIRYSDSTEEGIVFQQQKTSAKPLICWTPDLRATVERESLQGNLRALTLLHNDAKRQGLDPQTLAGHTIPAMTERYIRLRDIPQAEDPKFAKILDSSRNTRHGN